MIPCDFWSCRNFFLDFQNVFACSEIPAAVFLSKTILKSLLLT